LGRSGKALNAVGLVTPKRAAIVGFATQGSGGDDEQRLRTLLERCEGEILPFDHAHKLQNFYGLVRSLLRERPDLAVMEGTGIAGGAALLLLKVLTGQPYVVSSGDAVGPFVRAKYPALGPLFLWYERALYRNCAGFVGWSPYLTGRALTFGARRAMTVAGWAPFQLSTSERSDSRRALRDKLGIAPTDLVVGICGSLTWNDRIAYCYGYELVRALHGFPPQQLTLLIVGDGTGRPKLESAIPPAWRERVRLTGRVPRNEVPRYLAAMDVASLPQSVDQVGSFRYTTKLSEYLAAGVPVITGQIPLSYDLPGDWLWRLNGDAPWSEEYVSALRHLLADLTPAAVEQKRTQVPSVLPEFDAQRQITRFAEFVGDLLRQPAAANK
jgi:Glycosyl transferases group 1/Glycosyl transferase 4-like domain